jgi:hypothetical protein
MLKPWLGIAEDVWFEFKCAQSRGGPLNRIGSLPLAVACVAAATLV